MPPEQRAFAIVVAAALALFILALIRLRKLREEYAILWLLTALAVLVLVLRYEVLVYITELIGAVAPTTTLFIFSLLFLASIAIHFSIKISKQADQIKDLTQEIALLRAEMEKRMREEDKENPIGKPPGP